MATRKQRFYQGSDYHIFCRGNHREHVFRDHDDRRYFLSKLDELCERDSIQVIAYCLMDNHFHLLLTQTGSISVARMMRSLLTSYVKRTNHKYGLVGHLFQGPYQARFVRDCDQLAVVSRYIHRNPLKFTDIRTYRWSSYRQYLGARTGLATPEPVLGLFGPEYSYAIFLESSLTPEIAKAKTGGNEKRPEHFL
jgi:putative transposase